MNNQVAEGVGEINSRNYELKLIADNSEYSVSNLGATSTTTGRRRQAGFSSRVPPSPRRER